jgi:hypothetical protein
MFKRLLLRNVSPLTAYDNSELALVIDLHGATRRHDLTMVRRQARRELGKKSWVLEYVVLGSLNMPQVVQAYTDYFARLDDRRQECLHQ